MPIRLMIVDDHELVREGLRLTFEGTDIEVVAEAADGREALDQLKEHLIDVALVDIRMPRADGFQFLQMLCDAGMKLPVVLMHSVEDGTQAIRRCQDLGAKGLLRKGEEKEQLLAAIHGVHTGQDSWYGLPAPNNNATA